jgi:long-chain acyl-CoA synthetase
MFLNIDRYSSHTALISGDNCFVKYSELKNKIEEFSTFLEQRQLIFIIGENDVESLVCFLSAIDSRVVPLLLSSKINISQLNNLVHIYKPKYIFQKLDSELHKDYILDINYKNYVLLRSKKKKQVKLHPDLALLLTTSGSTGSPKLVRLTRNNLSSNAKSISEYLNISSLDRTITSLPFNYSYGLSVINSHLLSGGSIVLSNSSMMERDFWHLIKVHSVTSLSGVPYNYEMMLKLGIHRLKIPSIETMTQAGGKLNFEIIKKIHEGLKLKKIKFFSMYGQTEATARISYISPNDIIKKRGGIGKTIPGGRLWIEDKNGEIIKKNNTIGELIYSGKNVSMGYAESLIDLKLGDQNNGILRTGDLAQFDKDGYFYIAGSINRFIKIFGNRISLDSIEKIISNQGFECAVTGLDNRIIIYIIEDKALSSDKLLNDISNLIGINKSAIEVHTVLSFPRLDNGKIDYKLMRDKNE